MHEKLAVTNQTQLIKAKIVDQMFYPLGSVPWRVTDLHKELWLG